MIKVLKLSLCCLLINYYCATNSFSKDIEAGSLFRITIKVNELKSFDPKIKDTLKIPLLSTPSNKHYLINLEETSQNSGVFLGDFLIQSDTHETISAEKYIFFTEEQKGGKAEILGFASKEDYNAYVSIREREKEIIEQKANKKELVITKKDKLEQSKEAISQIEQRIKTDEEARKKEAERIAFEINALKAIQQQIEEDKKLSEQARLKRKQEAVEYGEMALDFYRSQNYIEAEKFFIKSHELDPENFDYLLKYAITLYQLDKYNESIAYLNLSKEAERADEKNYFLAMNYIKLKNIDLAELYLKKSLLSKDENIVLQSMFNLAVLDYEADKLEKAKKSFLEILDKSNSKELDRLVETYLDNIDSKIAYEKSKGKQFFIDIGIGSTLDTNISFLSDYNLQNGSSNLSSLRYPFRLGVSYRPIYDKKYEGKISYNGSYTYSQKTEAKFYDPIDNNIGLGFKYKTSIFSTPVVTEMNSKYDLVHLDYDLSGKKKHMLTSYIFNNVNSLLLSKDLVSILSLEYRIDKSKIPYSVDEDNSSGSVITGDLKASYSLEKKNREDVTGGIVYAMNNAKGDNYDYSKINLSGSYSRYIGFWNIIGSAKSSYAIQSYPKKTPDARKDKLLKVGGSLNKSFFDNNFNLKLNYDYSINSSNLESLYKYKKHEVGLEFSSAFAI